MSVLESDETPFQFIEAITSAFGTVKQFPNKTGEYRVWFLREDEQLASVGCQFLIVDCTLPSCTVKDEPTYKIFTTMLDKYHKVHRWIRCKTKEALPDDVRLAVDQLAPTKVADFLKNVTVAAECRDRVIARTTEFTDEKKEACIEKLPALATVVAYLKKRYLAATSMEKTALYNRFANQKWPKGMDFPTFMAQLRESKAAVVESGVPVDPIAVQNVLLNNLPDHAIAVIGPSLAKEPPEEFDVLVKTLDLHFRNRCTMNPNPKAKQQSTEESVDALALSVGSTRGGGARGRGRGQRARGRGASRGRGGRGGAAAGTTYEFREGKPVCAQCGGVGHIRSVCSSEPDAEAKAEQKDNSHTPKLVCSYCKKPGHIAEK